MERKMFLIVAALVLLFVQSAFAQTEELPDTVWTKFTYPNAVNAVKFTPDGKYLASGGDDGIPKLWDAVTGELVREFLGNGSKIWSLDINNTGELIAVVNDSSVITIWNVLTGEILKVIDYYGNSNKLRGLDLKFSHNGIYLAAILAKYGLNSIERDIILWNTHNWEMKSQLMDVAVPISLMFSPDDSKIAVSDIVLGEEKIVVAILNVPSLRTY
ncbi:hypothetical protein MASR1M45_12130 [Candidatus Kapaibacterium sp.]